MPAHLDPRRGFKRHTRRRHTGLARAGRIFAATVSVVVLAISGLTWATYRRATGNITHLAALPTQSGHPAKPPPPGVAQNILVVGDDSRNGLTEAQLKVLATQNDGGGVNTDTMMLVHVPANGKQASVVSLPRDLWVDIPGHGHNKLNAAYAIGSQGGISSAARAAGFRLLIETISGVTGVHIDHFVEVNLWGFYSISEAVGGIPVNLCQPVDDHYSGVDLPAGRSVIEGTQALAFVRQRHGLPNGDLDRERRQQYFIAATFHKIQSAGVLLNPLKLTHLLDAVTKSLATDPGFDPVKLVDQMRGLTSGGLHFTTIPISGQPRINGLDVITYDPATVQTFFHNLDQPATPRPTPRPTTSRKNSGTSAAPSASVLVTVRNATGRLNVATPTAGELQTQHFTTRVGDNLPTQYGSEIHYAAAGDANTAKALQQLVPSAQLIPDDAASTGITLVLGSSFNSLVPAVQQDPVPTHSTPTPSASATPSTSTAADTGCIN